ncbi:MAG: SEL1-like repeat protein [Pseudomonadota bacterium]
MRKKQYTLLIIFIAAWVPIRAAALQTLAVGTWDIRKSNDDFPIAPSIDCKGERQNLEYRACIASRAIIFDCRSRVLGGQKANSCNIAGNVYYDGLTVPVNYKFAAFYYRLGCINDVRESCEKMGMMHQVGQGVPIDKRLSATYFGIACNQGSATSCQPAAATFRAACNEGAGWGCTGLAKIHPKEAPGQSFDSRKLFDYQNKGCDYGDAVGCLDLAYNNYRGNNMARNIPKAVELYIKSCNLGLPDACFALATLYQNGRDVGKDEKRAATLLRGACDGGDMRACASLGEMYRRGDGVDLDINKAVVLFRKACEEKDAGACSSLAYRYLKGEGVQADYEKAVSLFRLACRQGNILACQELRDMGVSLEP